jgi:hypothetical protein
MKVKITASAKNFPFVFEKDYELSAVPSKDWSIGVSPEGVGYADLRPSSISQNVDRDLVTVHCETNLEDLWVLHKAGWVFCGDNAALLAFTQDRAVQRAVAQRDARIAKVRAEIAKAKRKA